MRTTILFCLVSAFLHSPNRAQEEATAKLSEPWTRAYVGPDATGDHVIALWQFDAGEELTDSSGNGHDLSLNGAKIAAGGRFGGCLESWRGWPDSDVPHQAQAQASAGLDTGRCILG